MSYFVERFQEKCKERNTTPYYVSLDCGLDPGLISAILSGTRKPKPATWLNILKKLSESKLLDTRYVVLVSWKAVDDYGIDFFEEGCEILFKERGISTEQIQEVKEKRKPNKN